jgi:hypothetical protein
MFRADDRDVVQRLPTDPIHRVVLKRQISSRTLPVAQGAPMTGHPLQFGNVVPVVLARCNPLSDTGIVCDKHVVDQSPSPQRDLPCCTDVT